MHSHSHLGALYHSYFFEGEWKLENPEEPTYTFIEHVRKPLYPELQKLTKDPGAAREQSCPMYHHDLYSATVL